MWGILRHLSERIRSPFSAGKLVTDGARGCAFLSAKPTISSRFLASPLLLKLPSGIVSLFKSYFTCCSVLIFWVSIMLWDWDFFPLCGICILSPPFILFGSALQSHSVHFYSSADVTWSNLLVCLLHCSFYSDQLFLFSNVCSTALWTKSKQ